MFNAANTDATWSSYLFFYTVGVIFTTLKTGRPDHITYIMERLTRHWTCRLFTNSETGKPDHNHVRRRYFSAWWGQGRWASGSLRKKYFIYLEKEIINLTLASLLQNLDWDVFGGCTVGTPAPKVLRSDSKPHHKSRCCVKLLHVALTCHYNIQ